MTRKTADLPILRPGTEDEHHGSQSSGSGLNLGRFFLTLGLGVPSV